MSDRITIDGSEGEGGGQILRTALALSLVTRLRDGSDSNRWVEHQERLGIVCRPVGPAWHCQLCQRPGDNHRLAHAPARSSARAIPARRQRLALRSRRAREPSQLTLEGGTHNPNAPPFDFLAKTFLPVLRRMGAVVEVSLERYGFYPAGGGRFSVAIEPCPRTVPGRVGRDRT
jgi:RNA 3'-terminal phosphate cyclase (ATP)